MSKFIKKTVVLFLFNHICCALLATVNTVPPLADSIKISSAQLQQIIAGTRHQWIELNVQKGDRVEDEINNSIKIKKVKKVDISKWIILNYNKNINLIRIYVRNKQRDQRQLISVIVLAKLRIPLNTNAPQLSNCQIEQINKFNRLFGDYFYADEHMEIKSLKEGAGTFADFYREIADSNWNAEFQHNLDDKKSMLRKSFPNVITMNLKFGKGGLFFPEIPAHQLPETVKKEEWYAKRNRLFVSDTIQKITAQYNKPVMDVKQKNIDDAIKQEKVTSNKLDTAAIKINEALNNLMYKEEFDKNGYDLQNFAKEVQQNIKKYHIQNIYFFVHGYNVPHALAQVQGNRLMQQLQALHTDTILFIRIFWNGGNSKQLKVSTEQVNQHVVLKKMTYKDKLSLKNAKGFSEKTKEAIQCAYSLRRLLHLLEEGDEANDQRIFHMVSHSLGAVILSHSLINDMSHIRYKPNELIQTTEEAHYVLDAAWMKKADSLISSGTCKGLKFRRKKCMEKRQEALDYITFMRYNPLPNLKIRVFMNAPAIPGVQLFQFADVCHNYHFTVGHNLYDPTLAKRFAGKKTLISGKLSRASGNTSLGLNYKNEVGQTEFLISMNKLKNPGFIFNGCKTSNFFEHDIFFYMQHPLFTNALTTFIKQK